MIRGQRQPWRRRSEPFVRDEPAFTLFPVEPVQEEGEDTFPVDVLGPLPVSVGLRMLEEDLAGITEARVREQQERQIIGARLESMEGILRDMQNRWEPNF